MLHCAPLPVTLGGRALFLKIHRVRVMGLDRMENPMR